MATFVGNYIRIPICKIDAHSNELLDLALMTIKYDETFQICIGTTNWPIDRGNCE